MQGVKFFRIYLLGLVAFNFIFKNHSDLYSEKPSQTRTFMRTIFVLFILYFSTFSMTKHFPFIFLDVDSEAAAERESYYV